MKLSLIKHFFNQRYYVNIIKRIMYYDSINRYTFPPKESCVAACYRVLFLKEPPPYYTEYRNFDTDPKECDELFDLFILNRRKKYGYSKRIGHSLCHSNLSDGNSGRRSSLHSSTKFSHKITILIPKKSTLSLNQATQHSTASSN